MTTKENMSSGLYSQEAMGESGPWVRWLPLAWRMVADPSGLHRRPARPGPRATLPDRAAWWSPVLHLTGYGLGWAQPQAGLARWLEMGHPTEDPILKTIGRWWGPELEELIAWGFSQDLTMDLGSQTLASKTPERLRRDFMNLTETPQWQLTWGGGSDPLHLADHAASATQWEPKELPIVSCDDSQEPPTATLVQDSYPGWYRSLEAAEALTAPTRTGRSRRVDVVIRRMGWLGTYRRSRQTGLWFRGRHQWHELGYE